MRDGLGWLRAVRDIPEYVETYGDPLNRITHAERATVRVDAWEREIDSRMAAYPGVMEDGCETSAPIAPAINK